MEERTFEKGTPIRCNRCGAKGTLSKDSVEAIRENGKAWRLQRFSTPDCGHMDCHWVYDCDLTD